MWWPIDTHEAAGARCEECGEESGLSRDSEHHIYCSEHRNLHR